MRIIAGFLWCIVAFSVHSFSQTPGTTNKITGQWDFNQGDLRATVGSALQFRGDTASVASFEQVIINGQGARVLRLPALSQAQGLIMPHGGALNNGTNINEYTLVMDVFWPTESDETWRALLQGDTNNVEDAILFVNPANALGIDNVYEQSALPANTWHRIVVAFYPTNGLLTLDKYVLGTSTNILNTQTLGENPARFSLGPTALLFSDNDGESQPVLINSIQFRSVRMDTNEVFALGPATAGGISGGPEPLADVKIETVRRVGSEIVMTVSGGGNLQLQKSITILTNSWQNVGSPAVTNVFRAPATDPKTFYRFQRL